MGQLKYFEIKLNYNLENKLPIPSVDYRWFINASRKFSISFYFLICLKFDHYQVYWKLKVNLGLLGPVDFTRTLKNNSSWLVWYSISSKISFRKYIDEKREKIRNCAMVEKNRKKIFTYTENVFIGWSMLRFSFIFLNQCARRARQCSGSRNVHGFRFSFNNLCFRKLLFIVKVEKTIIVLCAKRVWNFKVTPKMGKCKFLGVEFKVIWPFIRIINKIKFFCIKSSSLRNSIQRYYKHRRNISNSQFMPISLAHFFWVDFQILFESNERKLVKIFKKKNKPRVDFEKFLRPF